MSQTTKRDQLIEQWLAKPDLNVELHPNDVQIMLKYNDQNQLTTINQKLYYTHEVNQVNQHLMTQMTPFTYLFAIMYLQNVRG